MKIRTTLHIKEINGTTFDILFKKNFSIEMINDEELKLLIKTIELIELSYLKEEDDKNEQNSR
jgi:hypothetical protein